MTRRIVAVAALLLAFALIGAGCSGDDDGSSTTTVAEGGGLPLRIDEMSAAVAAVEAELGGEQRYFEVNATPTLVNLFVAGTDATTATAYVYDAVNETLGDPSEPQPASGNTFTWSQADFHPANVATDALGQLPNALPRTFAVTAASADAVQYLVTLESTQGGVLDVLVDKSGTVLGAQARD